MTVGNVQSRKWREALNAHGYRLTPAKEALLDALSCTVFPISAEKLWERVRKDRPRTGRATVYRLFDALEAHGFLSRVHGLNHCSQYVLAQDSSQPLFVCLTCGKAEFLPADDLSAYVTALSHQSGYVLHSTHIQLLGICTICNALV